MPFATQIANHKFINNFTQKFKTKALPGCLRNQLIVAQTLYMLDK